MTPSSPIVVLDSGLGGLTVVRAIRSLLPAEDVIYFGDTARLPYGSKSPATICAFVHQIIQYLQEHEPKHVVLACNTATALALEEVRRSFPQLSISGVIDPGARAAVAAAGAKDSPLIGVLATEATVRSGAYERAVHRRRLRARILSRPAALLVPIIEEGRTEDDPLVLLCVEQYCKPMVMRGLDVLVLGCTHYPILRNLIQQVVGDSVPVIDSAEQCADDVARRLRMAGLLRGGERREGRFHCFVTDDGPRFAALASHFLGMRMDAPTVVSTEQLYQMPVLLASHSTQPTYRQAI